MRSPQPLSPVGSPSLQFLIPPFERVRFCLGFVLATGFAWGGMTLALHRLPDATMLSYLAEQSLLATLITGLVSGLVVSAVQWLVLRRYIPDWLWILASAVGYVLLTTTLEAWWGLIGQVLEWSQLLPHLEQLSVWAVPVSLGALRVLVAAGCAIWLGVAQWLVLRHYTRHSQGWIWVPPIAVLLSSGFIAIGNLLPYWNVVLPLEPSILAASILGTTQAISACLLQRKSGVAASDRAPHPVLSAPEILNYGVVQTLSRKLHRQVHQAWTNEHQNDEALTYLVGVTDEGAIAAYRSVNQAASEQAMHTPMAKLVIPELVQRSDGGPQPLARFNLTFLPSGGLRIQPWRGVPLAWLAAALLTGAIVLSAVIARLMPSLASYSGS
jgi:hypothetical protein